MFDFETLTTYSYQCGIMGKILGTVIGENWHFDGECEVRISP